jgi:hypothetical protein
MTIAAHWSGSCDQRSVGEAIACLVIVGGEVGELGGRHRGLVRVGEPADTDGDEDGGDNRGNKRGH